MLTPRPCRTVQRYLIDAADKWLASVDWKTRSGRPDLAVHARSYWESRVCSDAYNFCAHKVDLQLRSLLGHSTVFKAHKEVASVMCFVTPDAINLVLNRSELAELTITNCSHPGRACRPWFLASDHQSANVVEELAADYGAVSFDYKAAKASGLIQRPGGYPRGKAHDTPWEWVIGQLEASYIDIYLLTRGEAFIGNVYSTFSSTVCKMRPRGAPSNVCEVLTTGARDKFIESLFHSGLPSGWHQPWDGDTALAKSIAHRAERKRGGGKCE